MKWRWAYVCLSSRKTQQTHAIFFNKQMVEIEYDKFAFIMSYDARLFLAKHKRLPTERYSFKFSDILNPCCEQK